ncbi:2,3-bisphosphoglycerate-independent phosphoglycerate mutase [Blattabacterium cuenoti]|uniref:2,3-bisphosphoglycerate-independent phosphoglycerate mutase n=1 Tax=Blattabacterium cuenoti TaxID=1653831 RepID=UPI00163C4163|nr:2,3-bisphosphoglycerate-independent phosphoglycerate mutase [Blattabacterium cuenoti]
MKKLILIILDGWGIPPKNFELFSSSAIEQAKTPFIDYCYNNYPYSKLIASGEHVGLPKGQMGNSEVGHINLGSGRKIVQSLKRINLSIKNGTFKKKIDFLLKNTEEKKIHFIGLLSNGGIHSHINHLFHIIKILYEKRINKKIYIHAFTDGRDTSAKESMIHISNLMEVLKKYGGQLSTVIGRYYAMDRDFKWERTKIAYDAMVNCKGFFTKNIFSSIEDSYKRGITDEFLQPFIIVDENSHPIARIKNGDIVFCFNFRSDRSRQITELFIGSNNPCICEKKVNITNYITMTCYNNKYNNVLSMFKEQILSDTIGEVLEKEGRKQIRISETEKYPHVTYFFSGGREIPFENEIRIMCPSPKVSTYDLKPEMSSIKIVNSIIPKLRKQYYDFICLNFANPDMVGHTGKMLETIKACEFVDKCTRLCVEEAIKNFYMVVIVGDHGNAECMLDINGEPNTKHTTSPVPFIFIENKIKKENIILREGAILSDVAPTILKLMNLPIPEAMTGNTIIKSYKR